MQLYWLGRSIPELADLPLKARRRLHINALLCAPWVLALSFLLITCVYFAGLVPTLLIAREMIDPEAISAHGIWAIIAVVCVTSLVAFVPSWIIGRPILFHFLRPKYRMLREANESERRSTH